MAVNPPAAQSAASSFFSEFWPHLTVTVGAFAAVALGAADHFAAHDAWGVGVQLSLIWGGLGALGVTAVAAVKAQ